MSQNSVIMIGIDSLDIELVRTWSAQGHLPNFKRLMEDSRWGKIRNPQSVEAGSVWPTFTTGYQPDHTGLYNGPYRVDPSTYRLRVIDKQERSIPPIWVDLSKAGKRVAVVDMPYELLEDELNGVQVTDWMPHVFLRYPGPTTLPPELADDLVKRYGGNPFPGPNRCPTNELSVNTIEEICDFRDQLLDRVERKLRYCQELLSQERWDFFATTFHDAHEVGHMCWHIHDDRHEDHDGAIAAQVGNPILDVYKAIDRAVGVLHGSAWDGATVLVYLSHGIGAQRTGTGLLDDILIKLQQIYASESASSEPQKPANSHALRTLAKWYRKLIPDSVRAIAFKTGAAQKLYKQLAAEELHSRPFFDCCPNHATGGVRINLKGREKYGIIEPGEEYDQLCERLASDMEAIINTDTGKPIVAASIRTDRLYDGPRTSFLPDVLFEWEKSAPINRVESPKLGVVERTIFSTRTGDHVQKRGAFFATGPGIEPGRKVEAVDAIDFAPTIAAILGLEATYQGTAIQELSEATSERTALAVKTA